MELHQVLHGGHPTVTSCYSDATSCLRYWDFLNQSYSDVPVLPTFMYSLCSAVIVIRLEIYMHHMTITSVQLSRISVGVSYINPNLGYFIASQICVCVLQHSTFSLKEEIRHMSSQDTVMYGDDLYSR